MLLAILEKWVENGSFNPECMAEGDYSNSTVILVILNPNAEGTDLESVGIGLIVVTTRHQLHILTPFLTLLSMPASWWKLRDRLLHQSIGRFAQLWVTMVDTWYLPQILCFAWPIPWILFIKKILPRWHSGAHRTIQFHSPQMVHWCASYSCGNVQSATMWWLPATDAFLFLEVCSSPKTPLQRPCPCATMPHHTVTPKQGRRLLSWPQVPLPKGTCPSGATTGDPELHTAEEVITLRNAGIFKSSSGTSQSLPKLLPLTSLGQAPFSPTSPKATPHSPKTELDSSSKKWDHKSSSKSQKHPVSLAAGSSTALEKTEQDHDAECRWRERSRECEDCTHSKSKSSHWECTAKSECGRASKHSRSAEPGRPPQSTLFQGMMCLKLKQITWPWTQMHTLTRVHLPSATSLLTLHCHKFML